MDDVERLHYVNGRRLEAVDLQLEQDYLVGMRRRLNRGLFTPGVVSGFEVHGVDATHVSVARGLALDPCGREIVLVTDEVLPVPAQPPSTSLGGYFLVASYGEDALVGEDPDCAQPSSEAARIHERPQLAWTEDLPFHDLCGQSTAGPLDCAVALALVSLDSSCQIKLVDISPRDIARPAHVTQVQALALEGEKDIDADNPKRLHFVIRGGAAASVVLYLWADRFSSLYYTQLGQHHHTLSHWQVSDEPTPLAEHRHDIAHDHALKAVTTLASPHSHILRGGVAAVPAPDVLPLVSVPALPLVEIGIKTEIETPNHTHPVVFPNPATQGDPTPSRKSSHAEIDGALPTHHHTVSANVDAYGSPTYGDARTGAAYQFFGDLTVELDDVDITKQILRVMPGDFHNRLGDTTKKHPLVTRGTPGIELTTIARAVGKVLDSSMPHELTFRLKGGGGKLLYNLFVA